ncbi:MAG: hypothetical protein ACKV1O_00970 [Saprospiraceae bacterium]
MKYLITTTLILTTFIVLSCQDNKKELSKMQPKNEQQTNKVQPENKAKEDTLFKKTNKSYLIKIYNSKYLDTENVLINEHKIILSKKEFNIKYKNIDSTATTFWECGSPFEWLDRDWMIRKYGGTFERFDGKITTIYGKWIEFNTNNHIVLFDMAFAKHNSFRIISHNIVLNKNTTLKEFQEMFPNSEMEKLENQDEVRFRFRLDPDSDDAFLFDFKDGKLNYYTLWWLLC